MDQEKELRRRFKIRTIIQAGLQTSAEFAHYALDNWTEYALENRVEYNGNYLGKIPEWAKIPKSFGSCKKKVQKA